MALQFTLRVANYAFMIFPKNETITYIGMFLLTQF